MEYGAAWLNSMIDATIKNHSLWQEAFQEMEHRANMQARNMEGPFILHGEIDCPEEMLYHPNVTWEMVQSVGKTNWLETLDGEFITVSDAVVDSLIDAGKICRGECYHKETKYDTLKNFDERVKYRIDHQHIPERMAKEIVSDEMGLRSPFKYTYIFEIIEVIGRSDCSITDTRKAYPAIEADSLEDAEKELYSDMRKVGDVVAHGFTPTGRYTSTVISLDVKLIRQEENLD